MSFDASLWGLNKIKLFKNARNSNDSVFIIKKIIVWYMVS